ncbi:MAG: NADH-quinone oxidoreductase subunit J [bacterium]|nr:NADH-quinone oxidoreductase subunit J [bacterium]
METVFFFIFGGIAVVAALLVVLFRNPVYSALSLVATFFCLAGLFVLLDAHFLAAVQIIIYAGAIMVLFLFVIMLLNLGHSDALEPATGRFRQGCVIVLGVLLVGQLARVATHHLGAGSNPEEALLTDNVPYIGELLYTDFLFPFEVASMILLVALIGVVVLVKRETGQQVLNIQEETQAEKKGQEPA